MRLKANVASLLLAALMSGLGGASLAPRLKRGNKYAPKWNEALEAEAREWNARVDAEKAERRAKKLARRTRA